jgi:Mg-chelatase subunit ChlD
MYYGLSIYAQKMVFIIDTSGSMLRGGRLMAAKRELLQAIDGLADDAQFSVIAFNGEVYIWQKQLMQANATMKQAASRWVGMLETGNTTASYDALETGMRFDAEAIFFLTDGAPQGGSIDNPADIVTLITRANYAKRMSIYTIGIGVQGGIFDEFLTSLAKHNWGIYRRVDQ